MDGSGSGCVEAGTLRYSPCEWVDGSGGVEAWTLYSPCECLGLGLGVWKQSLCVVLYSPCVWMDGPGSGCVEVGTLYSPCVSVGGWV